MSLKWNGDKAEKLILDSAWEGLVRATEYYYAKVEQEISIPNPGERRTRKRSTSAGKAGSSYTVYPSSSKPSEPPRVRTGFLLRSMLREYDKAKLTSRVGLRINAIYGAYLELAREARRRRPWLLATLNKYLAQIKAAAK